MRFAPGSTLIEQGSKLVPQGKSPHPLYVIQSGQGGVYVRKKHAASPEPVRVGAVHPGEIVGDMALYADTPPSVSIRAEPSALATSSAAAASSIATATADQQQEAQGVLAWQIDKAAFDEWIASRPAVKRSLEQRKWLWRSLAKNYLFRGLDDDLQKESLLSKFEHSKAERGQPIVQFGEQGDRFYVVESGTCDVEVPKIGLSAASATSTAAAAAAAAAAATAASSASSSSSSSARLTPHETDEEDVAASGRTGLAGKVALVAPAAAPSDSGSHAEAEREALDVSAKLASGKAWAGLNPLLPQVPMVKVAHKAPGESFGEIALLYNVPRCATVRCVAPEGCNLWSVDAASFLTCASKGSLYLKHIFFQHASVLVAPAAAAAGGNGKPERMMNQADFTRAVKETKWGGGSSTEGGAGKDALNESSLKLMFHLADQSGDNLISFSEFVLLYGLLQAPFTRYQMAFRMFDRDKNGFIDRAEFLQVIRSLSNDTTGQTLAQVSNDPLVVQLFGREEDQDRLHKQLTYAEFETLLSRDVLPSFLQNVSRDLKQINEYWVGVDLALSQSYGEGMMSGSALSNPPPASAVGGHTSISWKSLVAGGVAGAVSRTIVSPFERLKLLFQMQGVPPKYTGVLQGLRLIHAEDGMKGYFRGNLSNVIRITPASAFQFFFYDCFKKLFFGERKDLHPLERLGAGGFAGMTACLLTYPLDFLRARLTLQGGTNGEAYKGIWHGLSTVAKTEGLKGVYKGLWPSLVGIFPYIGIDFAVYETLRTNLPPSMHNERGESSRVALFCCGAAAGIAGQTCAYPLDLVRRRMQVQGFANTAYTYPGGIFATMKQIVRAEGIQGLYKGMIPNYVKVVPAVSVSFMGQHSNIRVETNTDKQCSR